MNSASDRIGFRGFASKLRDQAKDVVGNYKLPSFDDMAKNDEYIHSPDFNVRGGVKSERESSQHEAESNARTSAVANGTSLNDSPDEASRYSTASSWSLLDRPSNNESAFVSGGKTTKLISSTETSQLKQNGVEEGNIGISEKSTSASSVSERMRKHSKDVVRSLVTTNNNGKASSASLLSVVSDTLNENTSVPPAESTSDNESNQSSEDFDEEDPILSIIRRNQNSTTISSYKNSAVSNGEHHGIKRKPASEIVINTSSNRFMEDIRLQAPPEQVQGIESILENHSTTKSTNNIETKGMDKGGPFRLLFKSAVIQNLNRMILRKGLTDESNDGKLSPPLARERTSTLELKERETFEIISSTSAGMLGDEDLRQLEQLKMAGESSAAISSLSVLQTKIQRLLKFLREHRHLILIIFTLLLSVYVYFRRAIILRTY